MKLSTFLIMLPAVFLLSCTAQDNEQARREKDAYKRQVENRMKEIDRQIDELEAQIEKSGEEARSRLKPEQEALNRYKEATRQRLAELEAATVVGWETLKEGTDRALAETETAIRNLRSHID